MGIAGIGFGDSGGAGLETNDETATIITLNTVHSKEAGVFIVRVIGLPTSVTEQYIVGAEVVMGEGIFGSEESGGLEASVSIVTGGEDFDADVGIVDEFEFGELLEGEFGVLEVIAHEGEELFVVSGGFVGPENVLAHDWCPLEEVGVGGFSAEGTNGFGAGFVELSGFVAVGAVDGRSGGVEFGLEVLGVEGVTNAVEHKAQGGGLGIQVDIDNGVVFGVLVVSKSFIEAKKGGAAIRFRLLGLVHFWYPFGVKGAKFDVVR